MNTFQLLTADWRIRLLAQITCAGYRPIVLPPTSSTASSDASSDTDQRCAS